MMLWTYRVAILLSLPVCLEISAPYATAQSYTDAWDISQGAYVTASSGGTPRNMFGAMDLNFGSGAIEPGVAFMDDGGRNAGFVHFVEFQTPAPISLIGYHLYAGDDPYDNPGDRGFTLFSLYAFNYGTSSYDLIDQFVPASNPYPNDTVDVIHTFGPVLDDKFRVEFTQYATGSGPGPRITELDAITTPTPEPSWLSVVGGVMGCLVGRRRSR